MMPILQAETLALQAAAANTMGLYSMASDFGSRSRNYWSEEIVLRLFDVSKLIVCVSSRK